MVALRGLALPPAMLVFRQDGIDASGSSVQTCQPNFHSVPRHIASSSVSNWWTINIQQGQAPLVTSAEAPVFNFTFLPEQKAGQNDYVFKLFGVSNNTLVLAPNSAGDGLTVQPESAGVPTFQLACSQCDDTDAIRPFATECNIIDSASGKYVTDDVDGGLTLMTANGQQDQQFDFGLDAYVY